MSQATPPEPPPGSVSRDDLRVPPTALRWECDERWLPFETTGEVEPIPGIVGQDDALESLRFGLEIQGAGQNVFVRGLAGSGRLSLVRQLLEQIQPSCPLANDRCYVHDLEHPDRPRLLTVPRGKGNLLRRHADRLIEFIRSDLGPSLSSDAMRARRSALDDRLQEEIRQVGEPLEEELRANSLALVPVQAGRTVTPAIFPVIDGEAVAPDKFLQLRSQGSISAADAETIRDKIDDYTKRMAEISGMIGTIQERHRGALEQLYESEARGRLLQFVRPIEEALPYPEVQRFLQEVIEDVVTRHLDTLDEDTAFTDLYRVNVILGHDDGDGCPVVIENSPTLPNLLGSVDREFAGGGLVRSDHMMIRAGTLLRADGGFLILEARDVLSEPGAWKSLVRTLRTGRLEIVPSELSQLWTGPLLKPEPIEVNVKVILLGDPDLYYMLDAYDPDFSQLFKVLADFDTTIPRIEQSVRSYAGVLARIGGNESLLPFQRDAVAALTEHGARIAARRERLTTRFSRVADVAREASFLAQREGTAAVSRAQVEEVIRFAKRRADLPARRFRKLVEEGSIRIQINGLEVGQVNGLAVIRAGPLNYGFPTRITGTIGPGSAGAINIEREAQLSGAIHTKGFYILGGLLRFLLRTSHPLAFSASIAFEQSYGGIDGDSASGAEMCCLLSALTAVPLRQDLAMTGAIDQVGNLQPVGAVTEKIEGFFETCRDLGMTGTQGVLVPAANVGDLMLRRDVVEACEQGRFHVYAVETIHEALELLTGRPAGSPDAESHYPPGTLLGLAVERARAFWRMAATRPLPDPEPSIEPDESEESESS